MDETFANVRQAYQYLIGAGWKVSQRAVYNHHAQGKLKAQSDGGFSRRVVDKYAKTWLKRAETGKTISDEQETLQRTKLEEEIARIRIQRRQAEFDFDVKQGKYLPREDFELELAARAAILEAGFRYFFNANAPSWIAMVNGDPGKTPEFVDDLNRRLDEQLNEYATTKEFQVMVVESDEPAVEEEIAQ